MEEFDILTQTQKKFRCDHSTEQQILPFATSNLSRDMTIAFLYETSQGLGPSLTRKSHLQKTAI